MSYQVRAGGVVLFLAGTFCGACHGPGPRSEGPGASHAGESSARGAAHRADDAKSRERERDLAESRERERDQFADASERERERDRFADADRDEDEEEEGGKLGERPDSPGEAMEFRYRERLSEDGRIPPNALMNAKREKELSQGATPRNGGIGTMSWTELGPGNIGGRTRSILIHPTQTNTMWLGSVGGGVWKTTNGGTSWTNLSDFLPGLPIGCMAMDPTNPSVLFAGTGEGFGNSDSLPGSGILKSIDGGQTWAQIASTIPTNNDPTADIWGYVNRLVISPASSLVMLAATKQAIMRTTNGGTSWTQVYGSRTNDVKFHPTDGTKAVAGGNTGEALYSTNGGATWQTSTGIPDGGRVEVAYATGSPATVYASVNRNSGEVWRSTDGGQTYVLRNTGTNFLGSQGWYDNVIWVDPTNADTIVIGGGPDAWRSTNGGTSLTRISTWSSAPASAHADHHAIVPSPGFNGTTNRTVYFGNDGGIYRTNNVYTVAGTNGWTALNNNLSITQFYGGAVNGMSGVVVGGTQDNGTLRTAGSQSWTAMFGGDGGNCAADQSNPNYFYGEYVYARIHRSSNAGLSSGYIYPNGANPLTDAINGNANFISPFIIDPNEPNRLLAGAANLWRTSNVKASTPDWLIIKASNGSNVSAIAVAAGNPSLVWVGHNNGDVYKTSNGTAASPTWTKVDGNTPGLPGRVCKRIAIDPANTNRVYVSFSGFSSNNMWRTTNGGTSWTQITGPGGPGTPSSLPRAPINAIALHPVIAGWVYIGTDIGVFASTDFGANWSSSNDGPANVAVDDLIWKGLNTLIAVTHGRGMFSAAINLTDLDCNGNGTADSIDIQNGAPDCNGNGFLDSCEVAANPNFDCNQNGMPDNCEVGGADCNHNNILDACELATNPALDCNHNGMIDACEPGGDCDADGNADLCQILANPALDCDNNGKLDTCDMAAGAVGSNACASAPRAVPGAVYLGTTVGATNDGSDSCNQGGSTPPDVWFRYLPSSSGNATISLCGTAYDSVLSVHSGCPGTSANQIACDDDFCGGGSGSQVTIPVTGGATYMVRIAGFGQASGTYQLRITGPGAFGDQDCNANGVYDGCEPGATGPAITQQPASQGACSGQSVQLHITAIGQPTLMYQWQRGTTNLSDVGHNSGTQTDTLTISPATAADVASNYHVVVTNACRSVVSNDASLTVFGGGSGDTNGDSRVDGLDVRGVVMALLTGGPPSPGYCAADMNGDGVVSAADVPLFVSLLAQ